MVNRAAFAVVALFVFGLGVYDVNAIESNDRSIASGYNRNGEMKSSIDYPSADQSIERGPRGIATTTDYDELGRPIHIRAAGQELSPEEYFAYDRNGRLARHRRQQGERQIEERYEYDLIGRMTKSSIFDGAAEVESTATDYFVAPDANGVLKQYTDPTGEPTKVTNDGIGRPVRRDYADQTFEEIHYIGTRVDWTRDRQGREQHFDYDDGGRLFRVLSATGIELDHIVYENGRVIRWTTPDASIEFSNFDLDNHPQQITQHRLDANGTEIDTYTIAHSWNAAGELTHTGMPAYQGMNVGTRWTSTLDYHYDANGNVRTILRNGTPLMDATFRSAGRPITRNLAPERRHARSRLRLRRCHR